MSQVNFPTTLTLIRLVVSPLVLPILLVYFLPLNVGSVNCILGFLFIAFSLTDFFDGYLARKLDQETHLGKVLDPIADKFLIYSTLIALLAVHKIYFYWVVILIGREIFLMGVRQIALEHNFSVSVSFLGKFKTALQMSYLTCAIINPYHAEGYSLSGVGLWNVIEDVLLGGTLFLSVFSAQQYFKVFLVQFKEKLRAL